ncbi:hypothetical protein CTI12_AA267900 [Artemisia annua]|uniref:Uncharacterized protein n=1 Tax=Artemisia annua TaxID=35608 RepID=A0A2U1NGR8_ARTAN|nr:hypothetical protein CTI12_AA267900 [Artemisia annua]
METGLVLGNNTESQSAFDLKLNGILMRVSCRPSVVFMIAQAWSFDDASLKTNSKEVRVKVRSEPNVVKLVKCHFDCHCVANRNT